LILLLCGLFCLFNGFVEAQRPNEVRAFLTQTDGRTVFVQAINANQPCSIIFVHGVFGSHEVWVNQYRIWAPQCSTVEMDLLGHGYSSGDLSGPSNTFLSDDLALVINWTNATRILLIGWSFGGAAIQQYVQLNNDNRIVGLVLVDTFSSSPNAFGGPAIPLLFNVVSNPNSTDVLSAAAAAFIAPFNPVDVPRGAYILLLGSALRVNISVAINLFTIQVDFHGSSFTKPVLILQGSADQLIIPASAPDLQSVYTNSEVFYFEGGGHAPFLNFPTKFNHRLNRFIRTLPL